MLLRRIGSSMIAGYNTGKKMLEEWNIVDNILLSEDLEDEEIALSDDLKELTKEETDTLKLFVSYLNNANISKDTDPKYNMVKNILTFGVTLDNGEKTVPWKKSGCIIFSQYYDTVEWVAKTFLRI